MDVCFKIFVIIQLVISFASSTWADEQDVRGLVSASLPILKNSGLVLNGRGQDCYLPRSIGCHPNWIAKCEHLKRQIPEEELSFCTTNPDENKLNMQGYQCLNGINEVIANTALGPALVALALAQFLEKRDSACKGNTKALKNEIMKLHDDMLNRELSFMDRLYGDDVKPGTWEDLSCDQMAQINFCQSSKKIQDSKFCEVAQKSKIEAEKNFSESIFSRSSGASASDNRLTPVVEAADMSAGVIKTRLSHCRSFREESKHLISTDRKHIQDLKVFYSQGGSCAEAYNELASGMNGLLSKAESKPGLFVSGCYSDEYLSQKYCAVASEVALLLGAPTVTLSYKTLNKVSSKIQTSISPIKVSPIVKDVVPPYGPQEVVTKATGARGQEIIQEPILKQTKLTPPKKKRSNNWSSFNRENDVEFAAELKKFRGNEDTNYNPRLSGSEGQLFLSEANPNLTLKRFYKNDVRDPWEGVKALEDVRTSVEADPLLKQNLEITKIHMKGKDWILRDFDPNSVPLRNVVNDPAINEIRLRVLRHIKDSTDPSLQRVFKYLNKKLPDNLQWSPQRQRILIIDFSLHSPLSAGIQTA